jgi:(1->4)-alpha-D-glucan 1-alpha-D-glucosylmutase
MTPAEIWCRIDDGLPKLWVIRQTLKLRRERRLFAPEDDYRPLAHRGAKSCHVVAFARGDRAVTVVPRFPLKLGGSWGDTTVELTSGRWHNVFTQETFNGGALEVAHLLKRFPVALLLREDGS